MVADLNSERNVVTDPEPERPSLSPSGLVLPTTPLAEKEIPVVVRTPKRTKPPRHWIDLSVEERVQAVKDLGLPAFRARQISTHVFDRWEVDPTEWTDLPKSARQEVADAWFPTLLTQVSRQSCPVPTRHARHYPPAA